MAWIIHNKNELDSYRELLEKIQLEGYRSSRYKELLNCLVSIEYDVNDFISFVNFKSKYLESVGKTGYYCWERAERVYNSLIDRVTKPSYLKRLCFYDESVNGNQIQINQLQNIIFKLAHRPRYSLLTFVFFRPSDLLGKKRPGYVPCPIAGDFKFRKNELHLNVFFRSHDALNFGYADIYFLRKLQQYVLIESQKLTTFKHLKNGQIGTLNLHYSRAFIPLRMEMRKKEYINISEIERIYNCLLDNLSNYEYNDNYNEDIDVFYNFENFSVKGIENE